MDYTPIYHLIIAGTLIFLFWLWRQPEMQELIDRLCVPLAKALDKDYNDEMIRRCIKDFFNMLEGIRASTSLAEVESWYWEIDVFFNGYVNQVPDTLLRDNEDRLYDACNEMRDKLHNPAKVFDKPEISLS